MEQIIEDTLECQICKNVFNDPKILPCNHSFCHQCIFSKSTAEKDPENQKNSFLCFICHQKIENLKDLEENHQNLIKNHVSLNEMIEEMKKHQLLSSQPVHRCPCGELGKMFCEKCEIELCQIHFTEHVNSLLFKNHKIIDLMERNKKKEEEICEKHQKKFEMFCHDCNEAICFGGCLFDHKNHYLVPIGEESEKQRKLMMDNFMLSFQTQTKNNSEQLNELDKINQMIQIQMDVLQKSKEENEKKRIALKIAENSLNDQMDTIKRVISHVSQLQILDSNKKQTLLSLINSHVPLFSQNNLKINTRVVKNLNFIRKFGSQGSGDGQFLHLIDVTTDKGDNILVADNANHRIQIFNNEGIFLRKFGSKGLGDGQFQNPRGVIVQPNGNIVVADTHNHRIQIFNSNGKFIRKFGSLGLDDNQFQNPTGITVQPNGNILVADAYNNRIQMFDSDGKFLLKIGTQGQDDGQFQNPFGVASDSNGNIYVADCSNNRIQIFDSTGKFLRKFGVPGQGDGQLNDPYGIDVDSENKIIIADGNHRIQVFSSDGSFVRKIGGPGTEDALFSSPMGLAVNSKGQVIIADRANQRIQILG